MILNSSAAEAASAESPASLLTAAWTTGGCSEHGKPSRSPSSRHIGAETVTVASPQVNLTHNSTGPSLGVKTRVASTGGMFFRRWCQEGDTKIPAAAKKALPLEHDDNLLGGGFVVLGSCSFFAISSL